MLSVHPIPAFDDNYIWALRGLDAQALVVVDPGDAQPVFDYLNRENKKLVGILITHHHWDHTGGVEELKKRFDIPVYGPENSPFTGITHPLVEGDEINLLDHRFQVKAVPAHTKDHIAYLQPDQRSQLFCGDTLFLAGCGRLFEGTPKQMLSAMKYFASLPSDTEVYCTHEYSLANLRFAAAVEPDNTAIQLETERCQTLRSEGKPTLPSSIETELKINPYMRVKHPDVKRSAEHHTGQNLETEVKVLAAIREWKNNF